MKARVLAMLAGVAALVPLEACVLDVEERIPVVDEPQCVLPEEAPAQAPAIVERTPLVLAARCNGTSVSARDVALQARRADGSIDDNNFYVEQRVTAFRVDDECELHIDTTAWERKLDDLLQLDPIAARVTLCGARVTSSYADALGDAAPSLRSVRVGVDPDDAPPDLTTLVGTSQAMPVEDPAVAVVCGDAGDAFTQVERYAFHHRVVVRMSPEDALRLAWDGTLEVSLDVLYDP